MQTGAGVHPKNGTDCASQEYQWGIDGNQVGRRRCGWVHFNGGIMLAVSQQWEINSFAFTWDRKFRLEII